MSHSGTPGGSDPMRRSGQRGSSLITTLALTGILALLVMAGLSFARSSTQQSARDARSEIALQVADAGVNQYVSRLVEDPRYYEHFVDPAEDPRVDPDGRVHPPGSTWTPGVTWTYQGPSQTWSPLQDARFGAAAYSLRITPPAAVAETGVSGVHAACAARRDASQAACASRTSGVTAFNSLSSRSISACCFL